jgi:hypothetical protein
MKYQHYCSDWDGMQIDYLSVEFMVCNCFPDHPEVEQIKNQIREKYEAEMELWRPLREKESVQMRDTIEMVELIRAATEMLEAYEPDYENKWQYEDGYGKTHRRDWREDQKVRERLRKALEAFKLI